MSIRKNINSITEETIGNLYSFFENIQLTQRQEMIAEQIENN